MNNELMVTSFRTFLQMLGMVLTTKGILTETDWNMYVGVVMSGGALAWMLYARWGTIKVPETSIVIPRADPISPGDGSAGPGIKSPWLVGAIAIALALGLAGCNQGTVQSATDNARAVLNATCASYPVADTAFKTLVAVMPPGKIPLKVIDAESVAVAALGAICAAPPSDLNSAIKSAGAAYAAVMKALADARTVSRVAVQ